MLISSSLRGQKGIGTVNPNPSAALDIVSVDKGILLPRVALTDASVLGPITGTATATTNGILIYNTSTSTLNGLEGEGYYYWAGGSSGQWVALKSSANSIYTGSGTIPAGTSATISDTFQFAASGSTSPVLFFGADGQVGILTSTPSATLDVNGEGLITNLLITDNSSVGATVSSQSTSTIDDGDWVADNSNSYWYLGKDSNGSSQTAAQSPLVLTDNGRLGIGTTAPAVALDVAGDINATGSISTSSDRRYKIQIENLQNSLSLILQLRGVRHHWKREAFPEKKFPNGPTLGLIAQEVEPLIPELVKTDEKGYKSVDYAKLSALLTQALQEQQQMIDAQEERLKQIEKRLGINN